MESLALKCAAASAVALAFCAPATAQRAGQSISIQHGVVVEAEKVDLASAAGGGALVGGLAGFATSSGRSSSRRVRDALIGTAVGGAVAGGRGGGQGVQYTVDTGSGRVVVVSDQTQIAVGDCVAVENAGTGAANIRRVSSALCESANDVHETVVAELNEDATECLEAKERVLAAETDEALGEAIRTARILCDD